MSLFDTGIRPLIDQHLDEESKKVRDYGDYWSASSAGYCPRLVIMRRLGVPPVPEIAEAQARQQRVFSSGHIFHSWIQGLTKAAGLSIVQELELQDETLMVRGHFDDLVRVKLTQDVFEPVDELYSGRVPLDHLILYDYKTANSQSFSYKKEDIGYYHKMQLATYMYMLRDSDKLLADVYTKNYGKVSEARILQISKDDLRMREFQLLWTSELEKEVLDYWNGLNAAWEARKLPQCTCLEHDGGFMGKRSKKGKIYNDYFWEDKPCSITWFNKCKEEGLIKGEMK